MKALVNRYTQAPVRFVVGLSLIIQAFEDIYGNLEGRLLEALARLLAQNVRIYAYPMSSAELRERLKGLSASGWEWSETNGIVSATQLRRAPPLGHLFAYLLASNFLVPMQVPREPKSRRLTARLLHVEARFAPGTLRVHRRRSRNYPETGFWEISPVSVAICLINVASLTGRCNSPLELIASVAFQRGPISMARFYLDLNRAVVFFELTRERIQPLKLLHLAFGLVLR